MTTLDTLLELFADRRTVRHYVHSPLAAGDLDRIVEAGRRAPSGALAQLSSVIRVTDAGLRERLAALSGDQQHIRDAAEFFVFCLDVYRARRLVEHHGGEYHAGPRIAVHYGTMDAVLVAANIATAAEALGYGTCFIGGVLNNLDAIARELRLPAGVLPVVGLTVGVPDPAHSSPQKPRLPQTLVFHENGYRQPTPAELDEALRVMGESWFTTLNRYFGPNGAFARREEVWKRALNQQALE